MTTDYRRPGVAVENKTAPINGRQDVGMITGIIATADDGVTTENYDVIRSAASDDTDFVVNNLSDATVTHKGYAYTKDVDFDITAGGELDWSANTSMTPPYLTSAEPVTGAASLPIGTYYYKVAAIKCMDETNRTSPTSWGVTLPSNEKSITLSVASAVQLTWIEVPQAEGYHIYRGTSSGGETLLTTVLGEVSSFTDIGVYTPGVTTPVATSTALRKPSYSKAAVAAYVESENDVAANLAAIDAFDLAGLDINFDGAGVLALRNMDLRTGAATGAMKASLLDYYIKNASGTYATYYSGDASLNFTALKAVTVGQLKVTGKNLLENGDFGLWGTTTDVTYWATLAGTDWTVDGTTRFAVHTSAAGTHVLTHGTTLAAGTYRVKFTVQTINAGVGTITPAIGVQVFPNATALGAYEQTVVVAAPGVFTLTSSAHDCSVSNITVCKVIDTASFSLASANTLTDVATLVQTAIQALTGEFTSVTVDYNSITGAFEVTSPYRGIDSHIKISAAAAGAWTDLADPAYLYFTGPGYEIPGAQSTASCTYGAVSHKFRITSPTTGALSSIVVATSGVADDLWANAAMDFDGATPVAGVAGSYTTYQVVGTIAGGNYFTTGYYYTVSDLSDAFGANSDMVFYGEKYLLTPPSGNGGKIIAATGVPVMDRNTAQAAFTAQESTRLDLSTIITDDIDIIRDHYAHCKAMSTAAKSKWRVGLAVARKTMSVSSLVALALEINDAYYGIIYDNISQDDNISPYIGALVSSLPMVSDSIINRRLYTENALLAKPRLSAGTVDYLLANGIMVFDYNNDGVPCIIDDVMTAGSQYDLAGAISDTMLRYRIQSCLVPVVARVKMNRDGRLAVKNALVNELELQLGTLIDPDGGFTDPEVVNSGTDRYKGIVRFTYTQIYTMKRIDVEYYIA